MIFKKINLKRIKIENLRDKREVNQFLYFAKKNKIPKKK